MPNKGFAKLLKAIALLKKSNHYIKLNLFSAIYNDSFSYHYEELIDLVKHLDIEDLVNINKEYLTIDEVQNHLSGHDLIVFPYQPSTTESSSAAVRDALASLRPILVTPLPIFDDVADLVDYLPGTSSREIADGILAWIEQRKSDPKEFDINHKNRIKRIENRRFSILGIRLVSMIKSLEVNDV